MKDALYPLRRIHGIIHELISDVLPIYFGCRCKKNNVLLIFTPEHGNLGDHAIAEAEKLILQQMGISYFEISDYKLMFMKKRGLLWMMNGSKILINGGGYLGTLWFNSELLIRDIIKATPDSRIIALPNTVFYENNEWGLEEFKKSVQIYNNHPNLKIYVREYFSYNVISGTYKNVGIAPDMVLGMNKCRDGIKREGCVLSLRSDSERTMQEIRYN